MSSRVVLFAALFLALGAGLAYYLVASDDRLSRADAERRADSRNALESNPNATANDTAPNSSDPEDDGNPPPLRPLSEVLDSLESGSGDNLTLVRSDLSDLQEHLRSLRGVVDRATRQRILRLLTTLTPEIRAHAGIVVGELQPDPATVEGLLAMLGAKSVDATTRAGILNALWTMPAESASDPLLRMIGHNLPDEAQIVQAIGRIGQPEAMGELVVWLDRPIPTDTRLAIEKALTLEAGSQALDDAIAKLKTSSASKRLSLLLIVSRIGGEEHGEAVREALGLGLEPEARRAAIRALGTIGDPESGRVLWDLAQSEDTEEARFATRALARIRNRETIDMLILEAAALPTGLKRVVLEAGASIRRPGPALLDLAYRGLNDEDKQTRVAAITVVGASRKRDFIPKLDELYGKRRDRATRAAIMDALWDVQQREATRTALALLEDTPDSEFRDLNLTRFKRRAGLRPEDAPR